MNSRERIMAVLTGNEPDRTPWVPLIDGYYTSSLPEQGLTLNEIETIKYVGADIILRHVNISKSHINNVEYKVERRGNEELRMYETPVGRVSSKYKHSGKTIFKEEPFIKTVDDLKIMEYIAENTIFEPYYDHFIETNKVIGEHGIASPTAPLTPIQALLQHEMGVEKFTYFIYDHTSEMEEYMEVMHSKNIEAYTLMAQSPDIMKLFIAYEDTSTTVMSPSWYKKYCKDYINQYADIMHRGNKIFITHMCGKIKGMVNELKDGKMDGIDSVCPPTTGDLWAHEALSMLHKKIIIGGIEPPALRRMSVEETKSYVREVLQKCSPYKNFMLSTGDATSYGTPIENLKAVSEVINEMK